MDGAGRERRRMAQLEGETFRGHVENCLKPVLETHDLATADDGDYPVGVDAAVRSMWSGDERANQGGGGTQ